MSAIMTTSSAIYEQRYNFNGSALPNDWTIAQLGAGMAVTVSGGNLSITTGTTTASKTILRCTKVLTVRTLAKFIIESISQRIAQNNFYFEVTNAAGTTYARWWFDGTTATSAKVITANTGNANTAVTVTTATTATGNPGVVCDIALEVGRTLFSGKVANSASGDTVSALFDRKIPQPDEDYYLQIVAENGASPASTTTLLVDAVVVRNLTTMGVTLQGAIGDTSSASSISVNDGASSLSIDIGGTAPALGSGVKGSTVPRVTIATDDIVPARMLHLDATTTYTPSISVSTALESARGTAVKASAGKVFALRVYNNKASAQWIQIHQAASAPADATVPFLSFPIAATSNINIDFGVYGIYCTTGIYVCNSTTGPTKTLGAADCLFNVQFM